MSIVVKVKYKYGKKSDKPNIFSSAQETVQVDAKTESAVIAALKKKHLYSSTRQEFIILEIQ